MSHHSKIHRFLPGLLSFLLPFALYSLAIFLTKHIYGVNPALTLDAAGQYVPFLAYLKSVLSGDHGLLYALNDGLGLSFLPFAAYYLLSPFNLLVFFFPESQIDFAFTFILLLKLGLTGLTAYLFFHHLNQSHPWKNLFFSGLYVFSGFIAQYFWCSLWLDAFFILPLLAIGLDRIIDQKSPALYLFALFYALFSNFYMAWMLSIFSCLWLIFRFFSQKSRPFVAENLKNTLKIFKNFLFSSLLAAGLAAVVLLPTFLEIKTNLAYRSSESVWNVNLSANAFFHQFTPGAGRSLRDGDPVVYVGILCLLLDLIYLFHPRISLKERLLALFLLLFFYLSFVLVPLNDLWHAGTKTYWLGYREAFIFAFFLIFLAYRATEFLKIPEKFRKKSSHLAKFLKITLPLVAVPLTIFDLGANLSMTMRYLALFSPEENSYNTEVAEIVQDFALKNPNFYRFNFLNSSSTLGSLYQLPTLATNSSLNSENSTSFVGALGFSSPQDEHYISTGNNLSLASNSLFGLKYLVIEKNNPYADSPDLENYVLAQESANYRIYENSSALPLAFSGKVTSLDFSANSFENLNLLYSTLTGKSIEIFTPAPPEIAEEYADLCPLEDQSKSNYGLITPLPLKDYYVIRAYDNNCYHYHENVALVKFALSELAKTQINFVEVQDDHLSGEFDFSAKNSPSAADITTENSANISESPVETELIFTINYDPGWTLKIDGSKVETSAAFGTLLSAPISPGKHTFELTFSPQGLDTGLAISTISLFLTAAWLALQRKKSVFSCVSVFFET